MFDFISEDFRLSCCMNILKWVIARHREGMSADNLSDDEDDNNSSNKDTKEPGNLH